MKIYAIFMFIATVLSANTFTVYVNANRSNKLTYNQWNPTIDYLNKSIPHHTFRLLPIKPTEIKKIKNLLNDKKIDFIITQPAIYSELKYTNRINRVLTITNDFGMNKFGSVLITHKDSEIKNISDIKNKTIAAVAPLGFGGWLIAYHEILQEGIDPLKDGKVYFTGSQKKVLDLILNKKYEVGVIRTGLLEKISQSNAIDINGIKVINEKESNYPIRLSTKLYPEWTFAIAEHVNDNKLKNDVFKTINSITKDTHMAIAGKYHTWSLPQNYSDVDSLLKKLQLAHYKDMKSYSSEDIIKITLSLLLIVILFLFYTKYKLSMKVQKKLKDAKIAAENANKAKSNFLASMSHEIRTPLNAIMGFIGLLKEKEEDPKKLNYLDTIDNSAKSLTNIINDILDFSKIESGKLNIDYTYFNPKEGLKVTVELFKAKCDEKSLSLHTKFVNLPPSLNGDLLRIKQVVNNLLSNAIKFTPDNKSIYLHIAYENGYLNISVKDEGIGISQEYQEKIFESFTQADASTTRQYGGTGLGLAISYNLIKLMDSQLKVKSQLGLGSEFYFSLPLEIGKPLTVASFSNKDIDLSDIKILLVEDNKSNQLFMQVLLDTMAINCDIASDGVEAIERFKDSSYDIILMDENMPNMNGVQATKEIIKIEKERNLEHTPIIALTANALKGDRERFLSAGMDEYLSKPVDKEMLMNTLYKFHPAAT